MVQTEKEVYLEKIYNDKENFTVEESLQDWTQPKYDNDDICTAKQIGTLTKLLPESDIKEKAWIILNECDPYDMLMLLDNVFNEQRAQAIIEEKHSKD